MTAAPEAALEVRGVSKHFGGTYALDDVSFAVAPGEVHGLLGQNGSGKSTLVKIVVGFHSPDGGSMSAWGHDVSLPVRNPQSHGIAVIHQDLGLVDGISVADNIGVASRYSTGTLLPVRTRRERVECRAVLDALDMDIPLDADVATLSPSERSGVAIARAMRLLKAREGRNVFILDEPTASLTTIEAKRVTGLMRTVADHGSSVVFISHRLEEVLSITDRMTVLRDGRRVSTVKTADATYDSVIRDMLGRPLESFYPEPSQAAPGEVLLEVRDLVGQHLRGVDLETRTGEVVGVTGLAGMGQEELPYLLAGVVTPRSGTIAVAGQETVGLGPRDLISRGVALVPANRQRDGGWPRASAEENITLPRLTEYFRGGNLRNAVARRDSRELMERLEVRPPDPARSFGSFSGGNQQKIVLARWLSTNPSVLLLDEPTQGVDAGAKREILELVVGLATRGATVLLCSGDFEQLANVCNRLYVLREGRVAAHLEAHEMSESAIAAHAHAQVPA